MKQMKLNFNVKEKTPSGRMYDSKNFLQKMNKQIQSGTFFLEYSGQYSSMEVDLKKIIGFIDKCKISKNGEVIFNVIPLNPEDGKYVDVIDECALSATGYVDSKGNTLINRIVCLRPSPEYQTVFKGMKGEEEPPK